MENTFDSNHDRISEIPQKFWESVEQFNTGQFYACHDTLEALWIEAMEPEKSFYQGVLQIAVALYHLENLNWRGAVILLGEGRNRLRRCPEVFSGIDVDELLDQSGSLLTALQKIEPNKIADFKLGENGIVPALKIIKVQE